MVDLYYSKEEIRKEASEWATELASGHISPSTRLAFDKWYGKSPQHRKIYHEIEELLQGLQMDRDFLEDLEALDNLTLQERLVAGYRGFKNRADALFGPQIARAGFAAALATVVAVAVVNKDWFSPESIYATQTAEIRDVTLEDGSIVTLGARSSISVDFSDVERRVALDNGEAFFSVTKDRNRPFIVEVDGVSVKVVGTKFDVRKGVSELRVSVVEGIVEVSQKDEAEPEMISPPQIAKAVLTAGEEIVTSHEVSVAAAPVVKKNSPNAWRDGRLVYEQVKLEEIVSDINRYYDGEISIASEELGQMRFTSAFRTDQIEQFITTLEVQFPVKVVKVSDKKLDLKYRY